MKALSSITRPKKNFFVRLPTQQKQKRRPVCQKKSHGGGSVMVWGCVAYKDMITKFLKDVGVTVLDWPPQSPDLNIIVNIWSLLKRKRTVS